MTSDGATGRSRGLVYVLSATAIAGVSGYAVQLLAPALLTDASAYVAFSVFWSTMYLFVGSISGVQQEVTRATTPGSTPEGHPLREFAVATAVTLVVVTTIGGLILAPAVFPSYPLAATVWLGVGLVGYLLVTVLAGVMYGLSLWRWVAALTVIDSLVRGVLVAAGLLLGATPAVLAALIAVPFGGAFVIVLLLIRSRLRGAFHLDVPVGRLAANSAATVTAAAATGVVVTGLPLLLHTLMPQASDSVLATLIVVITITRAPLIVPLMALQSFLVIDYRGAPTPGRRAVRYLLMLAGLTAMAVGVAALVGPPILTAVTGGRYAPTAGVVAAVVASAGLVGGLCITGPALITFRRHLLYAAGWVVAALVTVGVLLTPLPPEARTIVALVAAPLAGIGVHAAGVLRARPDTRATEHRSV